MNNDAIRQFVRRELRAVTLGVATAIGIGGGLPAAIANPVGGTVVSGLGSITRPNAATTLINQQSSQLTLNWSSFNVANGQTVKFVQPSSSSVALNNILSQSPSQIFGEIDANGRVVLINPNGILFGRTAQLNVGSLIASSLELKEYDPATGHLSFESLSGHPGVIDNEGTITAAPGGSVALLGGTVLNNGLVVADYGTVAMGAGQVATLDFYGGGLLRLQVSGDVKTNPGGTAAAVENSGTIQANGGEVVLTASAAQGVFASAVDNSGVIRAARIRNVGGVIELLGTDGAASDSGTLDASGAGASSTGGTVTVTGNSASLTSTAKVDVSGAAGGGAANIGGGLHGSNAAVPDASSTSVASGASVDADATQAGNGGTIAVWSDGATTAQGNFSANGGPAGGNGGTIETSGHVLNATGATVRAGATAGESGEWLLDPYDVAIDHGSGTSISGGNNGTNTTVFDADINAALKGAGTGNGTDVTIETSQPAASSPTPTGAITFGSGVTITNGDNVAHTLTLDADTSISLNATTAPSITSGAGPLDLVLNANANGQAQAPAVGSVTLNGTIDVAALTVTGTDAITQSGGTITVAGATTITTGSGNDITLDSTGNSFTGGLTLTGDNVAIQGTATTGNLTIDAAGGVTFGSASTDSTTVTGALVIQGAGGSGTASGAVSQAGILVVDGTSKIDAGTNDITLSNIGNAFTGALTLTGGAVTLANSSTTAVTTLAGTNSVSSLTLDITGPVAFGSLSTDSTAVTGALVVQGLGGTGTASGAVSQVGKLVVDGTSTIDAAGNAITLGNSANSFGSNVVFSGTAVTLGSGGALSSSGTATGNLSETAHGTISEAGAITVSAGNTATFTINGTTADVILGNTSNNFNGDATTITATGTGGAVGNVSVTDSNATFVPLTLPTTLTTLTLNDPNAAIGLSAETLTGSGGTTLSVTAGGAITQSGALGVTGATVLNAGTGAITLGNTANAFNGSITLTGGAVTLANSATTATTLTGTNSAGSLTLDVAGPVAFGSSSGDSTTVTNGLVIQGLGGSGTASGAVSQVGKLSVGTTTNIDAGGNAITLGDSRNSFGSNVTFSGAAVTLASTGALSSSGTASGNLDETAGGKITEGTGGIQLTGTAAANTATFTVTGGTFDVDLGNAANNFNDDATTLAASGTGAAVGNVRVADANASFFVPLTLPVTLTSLVLSDPHTPIALGPETLSGVGAGTNLAGGTTTLDVTAGGAITQVGVLKVTGTTALNAGTGSITLNTTNNTFSGNVAFTGAGVDLASAGALSSSGTASGNLDEAAGGTISEGAAGIQMTGTAGANLVDFVVTNGTQDVDLANVHNVFNDDPTTIQPGGGGAIGNVAVTDSGGTFVPLTLTGPLTSLVLSDPNAAIALPTVTLTGVGAGTNLAGRTTTLDVTAGGAITQSGVLQVTGTTALNAGANPIALSDTSNSFSGNVAFTGTAVTLASGGALSSSGTASGNLSETAGGTISEGSAGIQLSGSAVTNTATFTVNNATADVDLGNSFNSFNGEATTIQTSGNGVVNDVTVADTGTTFVPLTLPAGGLFSLTLTDTRAPIAIPQVALGGTLDVTAGGAITQTGTVSVRGNATLDAGANPVTLNNPGNSFFSNVAFDGTAVTLVGLGALSSSGTATGNLSETAGGTISEGGPITVSAGNTATFTINGGTGDVDLGNPGNNFNDDPTTIATIAGGAVDNVSVTDTNTTFVPLTLPATTLTSLTLSDPNAAIAVPGATITGQLAVTANGAITQTGALSVGGISTLNGGANAVTLADTGNNFGGNVAFNGTTITLASNGGLSSSGTATGTLSETAGGSITQGGALNVADAATLTAGGGAGDITLANTANAFAGPITLDGAAVTLANVDATNLAGASSAGNLTLDAGGAVAFGIASTDSTTVANDLVVQGLSGSGAAGGAVTQGGSLSVAGNTSIDAGTNAITLSNPADAFVSSVTLTGGAVTLANADATTFSGTSSVGSLTLDSGGAVSESGTLSVSGTSNIDAGSNAITLGNSGNSFGGNVAFTGAAVALANSGALSSSGTAAGTLTETAGGAITQGGVLNVTGDSTLTSNGGDITLAQANTFGGNVAFNGRNVTLNDGTGGLSSSGAASGTLTETAAGAISQGGALSIAGKSTLTANGSTGDITLANSGNAFAGPVTLAGGTVTLANADATTLAGNDTAASLTLDAGGAVTFGAASTDSTTVTGDLVVQGLTGSGAAAGGAVGEVGTLSVGGTTSIDAGGNAINLNQANTFGGAVSFAGGNVTLTAGAGSLTASGTATGTLTAIAKGPSSDLNVGALSAGGNVLLIAGDSVLGTSSQATVTANNVEVRYGLENGNGQLGSTNAAQQIEFVAQPGSPRVQLTLWLPAPGTQFQTGDLHQSASDLSITRHPFVAGEQATLYAAPFGVSPGQVAGTLATIQTTLQGTTTQSAGVAQGAATQGTQSVLYIDWGSYNPNVSLFGTLNPAVCLPADQRDESVGSGSGCAAASASLLSAPTPIMVAMVPTREGWKPMQLFRLAR